MLTKNSTDKVQSAQNLNDKFQLLIQYLKGGIYQAIHQQLTKS